MQEHIIWKLFCPSTNDLYVRTSKLDFRHIEISQADLHVYDGVLVKCKSVYVYFSGYSLLYTILNRSVIYYPIL